MTLDCCATVKHTALTVMGSYGLSSPLLSISIQVHCAQKEPLPDLFLNIYTSYSPLNRSQGERTLLKVPRPAVGMRGENEDSPGFLNACECIHFTKFPTHSNSWSLQMSVTLHVGGSVLLWAQEPGLLCSSLPLVTEQRIKHHLGSLVISYFICTPGATVLHLPIFLCLCYHI